MYSTFQACTSLRTAPTIPNLVANMQLTFCQCISLTGNLIINASNVTEYSDCLNSSAQNEGCNLVVSGTCPQLDVIIATKSSNSHITKGQ